MKVLGSNVKTVLKGSVVFEKMPTKQFMSMNKNKDKFQKSVTDAYTNYTKQGFIEGELEKKIIGVTKEQLEEMLKENNGTIQSDGSRHWMIIGDVLYEFKIISKDEVEEKKPKSNYQVLLDMTKECLEREQKRLDEVFHDWVMKKDILYPNVGKNAVITLEDIIKKQEEEKNEKGEQLLNR